MKQRILILLLVVFSACASPTIAIRPNVPIERLGICFEADPNSFLYDNLNRQLDDYIIRHNANRRNRFQLYRASPKDSTTIRIRLVATKFVSPSQQGAGVVVSMIGLSLPAIMASSGAPFVIFFYYFPRTKSMTEVSASADISNMTTTPMQLLFSSPGFLRSPTAQARKHTVYFERFLASLVKSVESQSKRARRNSYAMH